MRRSIYNAPVRRHLKYLVLLVILISISACTADEPTTVTPAPVTDATESPPTDSMVGGMDASDTQAPVPSPDTAAPGDAGPEVAAPDVSQVPDTGPDITEPPPPPPSPGNVVLHRLNRTEYNNTVRDLLLLDIKPAATFPADDHGFGYDNIATVLSTSPLLFEKWERAAEQALDLALFQPVKTTQHHHFEAEDLVGTKGGAQGAGWNLWTNGFIPTDVSLEGDGVWIVTVAAGESPAGDEHALMSFNLGDEQQWASVAGTYNAPGVYRAAFVGNPGDTVLSVGFHNDWWDPDAGLDLNLLVDWFSIEGPFEPSTIVQTVEAETLLGPGTPEDFGRWLGMEPVDASVSVTAPGTQLLAIRARAADTDSGELASLIVAVDGVSLAPLPLLADFSMIELELQLETGPHTISLSASTGSDSIAVDYLTLYGAVDLAILPTPVPRAAIMVCQGPASKTSDAVSACAAEILTPFASRAWRRPVTADELVRLQALVSLAIAEEGDFEEGLKTALRAIMLSPHFLFRVEIDPELGTDEPHPITDWELASRLSYALWSSMPDAELLEVAASGTLQDDAVLTEQVNRMLQDPRSSSLIADFVGQWLHLRALDDVIRDANAFPQFDDELAAAMQTETELVLEDAMHGDGSFLDLLDTDTTYVNDRLAGLYGLPESDFGPLMTGVPAPPHRMGVLTHASLLTVTSHTFRTSPVNRGKFVLGQLMCQSPPSPPSTVDTSLMAPDDTPQTVREMLEIHRADPECAGCHDAMDPVGLAFENFDAIGAWRTEDNGFPIDASGTLPAGDSFENYAQLIPVIKADPSTGRCISRQLMTFMLGRGLVGSADTAHVNSVAKAWAEQGHVFSELAVAIALSDAFRKRMPPPVPEPEEDEEATP
ncbi:MAG: hypothetical protein ACI9WU_002803 [Myxococcota bacterium]|jgi:hypothetical protein